MRVAINAQLLSFTPTYRNAGLSRYIGNLLTSLPAVAPEHQFTAFVAARPPTPVPGLRYWLAAWPTGRPLARILWEQTALPLALLRCRADLLHGPAYVLPFLCPCPAVLTVHDLSFLTVPTAFRRSNRLYLSLSTRRAVRQAQRIIAVSAHTKRDLVRLLGVPPEKITVVHHGLEHEVFRPLPAETVAAFKRQRGLPEEYILFVGTLEPRKNIPTLIRAFARLKREGNWPHKLVIAGGRGWLFEEIFALVERLGLRAEVLFPGYIPFAEQPLWYNGAAAFVYPSLYEGFGLPVLEAMACGTPVIAANASALPEVVGEGGLLVPPCDERALAWALAEVLADADRRAELARRGRERAQQFTWPAAARATLAVYAAAVT